MIFNGNIKYTKNFCKNFYHSLNEKISSKSLLNSALKVIQKHQEGIGGMVAFVKTEDRTKLIDFYDANFFFFFFLEKRKSTNSNELIQLFRFI